MKTRRICTATWLSPMFPILAASASFAILRSGAKSEFWLALMLVSFVCICGIPFYYAILSISRHDSKARKAAILIPLTIWMFYAVPSIAATDASAMKVTGFSLTLLGCMAVNLIPFWISAFRIADESNGGAARGELLYWSWPAVIPALMATYLALSPFVNTSHARDTFPILVTLMPASFAIYAVLYILKAVQRIK